MEAKELVMDTKGQCFLCLTDLSSFLKDNYKNYNSNNGNKGSFCSLSQYLKNSLSNSNCNSFKLKSELALLWESEFENVVAPLCDRCSPGISNFIKLYKELISIQIKLNWLVSDLNEIIVTSEVESEGSLLKKLRTNLTSSDHRHYQQDKIIGFREAIKIASGQLKQTNFDLPNNQDNFPQEENRPTTESNFIFPDEPECKIIKSEEVHRFFEGVEGEDDNDDYDRDLEDNFEENLSESRSPLTTSTSSSTTPPPTPYKRVRRNSSGSVPSPVPVPMNKADLLSLIVPAISSTSAQPMMFFCKVCNKTIIKKDEHIRAHTQVTQERPFSCPHCPLTFSQYCSRRMHAHIQHSEQYFLRVKGPHVSDEEFKAAVRNVLADCFQLKIMNDGSHIFACPYCPNTVKGKSNKGVIQSHVMTHHFDLLCSQLVQMQNNPGVFGESSRKPPIPTGRITFAGAATTSSSPPNPPQPTLSHPSPPPQPPHTNLPTPPLPPAPSWKLSKTMPSTSGSSTSSASSSSSGFACRFCPEKFTSFIKQRGHQLKVHTVEMFSPYIPRESDYQEVSCAIELSLDATVNQVPISDRGEGIAWKCTYCNKTFPYQPEVNHHLLLHHFFEMVEKVKMFLMDVQSRRLQGQRQPVETQPFCNNENYITQSVNGNDNVENGEGKSENDRNNKIKVGRGSSSEEGCEIEIIEIKDEEDDDDDIQVESILP